MTKDLEYNLPGYGFANCSLFDTAGAFVDLLDKHGLIEKSKNTCQLGTMKYVFPGAHHTRYEYIFTQLMLISNITISKGKVQRNVELSLGSKLKEFKNQGFIATGGDIMQCLAILSNTGHMYDTFTSSKILTRILQESREQNTFLYKIYKRNLPHELHSSFENMLNTSNYYKLHLYNMIHLLKGMVRVKRDEALCNFGIKLLTLLINPNLITNEATSRIFYLFKKVRKIAYLSVDMVYTPASFGANLNHMIYSISSCIDDLFNEDSPMNKALAQLEDIIHKQIYDSPMCILNTTRIEQEKYFSYYEVVNAINSIYDIRKLIEEYEEPYVSLHSITEPDILKQFLPKSELYLSGIEIEMNLNNMLKYDSVIIKNIPNTRVAFGTQISQDLKKIYSVFGLMSPSTICQDAQIVISRAVSYHLFSSNEKVGLIKYAIKSLYKFNEFFFNLSSPAGFDHNSCVIIGNGCKNIAKQIRDTFNSTNVHDRDQLHEILSCATVLEHISYTGLVLCFVGGIKASQYNKTLKIDEIDGFLYFPSRDINKTFAVIIEAKNYINGENDANEQLKETLPFLSNDLSSNISILSKCAYMELSIKST